MTSSRTQRLIELADQVASEPDRPDRRPRWPYAAAAALAVVAVVGIGFALTGGDDERDVANADATPTSPAASASTAAPTTEQPVAAAPATTAPVTAAPATTQLATTTTAAPSTTATPSSTTPATTVPAASATTAPAAPTTSVAAPETDAAIEQPVRWAEFSGGKVYLEGTVPDQATADEVRDKAGAVVGIDNVLVNYAIVAGAPRPPSAPLYVRDSVLFAKNSVDINSTARGVLDLGVVLMSQNPQITIDIEGHTDSDGSDEMNQALSQRRVDVIFDYLVSQGVDPTRLTKQAYGEARPIADNATAEGRAKNRRVEFRINNLLG